MFSWNQIFWINWAAHDMVSRIPNSQISNFQDCSNQSKQVLFVYLLLFSSYNTGPLLATGWKIGYLAPVIFGHFITISTRISKILTRAHCNRFDCLEYYWEFDIRNRYLCNYIFTRYLWKIEKPFLITLARNIRRFHKYRGGGGNCPLAPPFSTGPEFT